MTRPPYDAVPLNPAADPPSAGPLASEPVVVPNVIVGLVIAILGALREFGVPLTPGQHMALVVLAGAVLLAIATWTARSRVTPLADPVDNAGNRLIPARRTT